MAFIGNQPAESFTSFATQEFSTSATTSYTLDHAVTNENEIALFVNNVRQQPGSGKAYTATGTALTLSAATASTDTMYCVFLGRALQTVTPATNSITAAMVGNDLISGKTALAATPASTDELLISDAGTLKRIDASFFQNTPAFSAYKGSAQSSLSANQYNKITFTSEEFDTDSAYDATNSKFVAPSAGKYFFNTFMRLNPSQAGPTGMSPAFYKNGSLTKFNRQYNEDTQSCEIQLILDLSASDYIEVYLYYHDDAHEVSGYSNNSVFQGFKLIG